MYRASYESFTCIFSVAEHCIALGITTTSTASKELVLDGADPIYDTVDTR